MTRAMLWSLAAAAILAMAAGGAVPADAAKGKRKLTTGATQSKALPPESPNVYLKIEAESGKRKRLKAQ